MAPEYSIIVLAAGESTRFGENKLLYKIDGVPIVRRVVVAATRPYSETIVVLGHEAERVKEEVADLGPKLVYNPEYREGMSSSIRAGVRASTATSGILVLPGDVAFVTPELVDLVVNAHVKTGALIVVPTYKGKGGHPILFDSRLRDELLSISEAGRGLKEVVNRHLQDVYRVEAGTPRILLDIDYKEDLERAKKELEKEKA